MPAHRTVLLLMLAVLVLGSSGCSGGPAAPQPGWIADAADVLMPQQEADLTDLLTRFEARTTVQLVGVTVADLGGQPIEAYTRQLAKDWAIGQAGVNNGVMVLLALEERQVRIETGQGMTWTIPDARAAEIVEVMTPLFREEDYYRGLRAGFEQIIAANEGVVWEASYFTLVDARSDPEGAVGRIVSFEAVITKLEEDEADVAAPGVESARLLFTANIDPAAFSVEDELIFHARVKEGHPLVLYLLGFEEVDAM